MRKFLALLLTLTMMFCCGMTAFAQTGGSQTITLEVPDPNEIVPVFYIKKPIVGDPFSDDIYYNTANSENRYATLSCSVSDTPIDRGSACEPGVYEYLLYAWDCPEGCYFSNTKKASVYIDTGKSDENGIIYEGPFEVERKNPNAIGEPYALYDFTYTVTESWTLIIPSGQTIEFDKEENPVILNASVSSVENISDDVSIYVYAKHTGVFNHETDSTKTIPFILSKGSENIAADALFMVNENRRSGAQTERTDNWLSETYNINISSDDWDSAEPGNYATVITYSSSFNGTLAD